MCLLVGLCCDLVVLVRALCWFVYVACAGWFVCAFTMSVGPPVVLCVGARVLTCLLLLSLLLLLLLLCVCVCRVCPVCPVCYVYVACPVCCA